MKTTSLLILLFLMSAFAIGASLQDSNEVVIDNAFENASITINNITLTHESNGTYANGILKITESYMKFIGATALETTKLGIIFGKENPEYFESEFIISIIRMIIWLAIIGLLIRPVCYIGAFIVMSILYIKDYLIKRSDKNRK